MHAFIQRKEKMYNQVISTLPEYSDLALKRAIENLSRSAEINPHGVRLVGSSHDRNMLVSERTIVWLQRPYQHPLWSQSIQKEVDRFRSRYSLSVRHSNATTSSRAQIQRPF